MKNFKSISGSCQSAAKLTLAVALAFLATTIQQSGAVDPFSPPTKEAKSALPYYPTVAALLAATRSGEVPLALTSKDVGTQIDYQKAVGKSVATLLLNQGFLPKEAMRFDIPDSIGLMFVNLAKFELSDRKDDSGANAFQHNWKLFCEGHYAKENPRLRDELDSILKQFSQAARESMILQKSREEQRLAKDAEAKRQADISVERMREAAAQEKAKMDAALASKRAEDQIREEAVKQAMDEQAKMRQKKLEETLASPAYKLWQTSLQIEQGVRLIQGGQQALANEERIEKESGVADLKARRAAGERIAAGKLIVERAFSVYRELGGKAQTPEEVKAGADPAAEYR